MIFFLLAVYFVVATRPAYAIANDPARLSDVVGIIRNIISILAPAAAIAFFIVILVGGYQFLTSGGDPKATGQARNTLTYGIIGVILVVAAWLILTVIKNITGVDVTTVRFPT